MADHLEQRADIFVPGGGDRRSALGSVTHLVLGAHPDDCGFMAFPGTEECRRGGGKSGAVVLTDGAGGGCDLRLDWGNGEKFAFALWVEDFTLRIVDRLRAAVADRLSRMGPCLT